MSLQKRSWSVSALAVEFALDRRTCAKRLDAMRVQPVDHVHGAPRYCLTDAALALRPRQEEAPPRTRSHEGYDSATLDVRSAFVVCEPAAMVLIQHTQLSPEEILQLVPRLWAAFENTADEMLGRTKLLKHLPIELHDRERRDALLKRLGAESAASRLKEDQR